MLCDIDPHHVCLSTECTEEVINEAPKEAEKAKLGLVNLSFPDAVQLLEVPCIWIGDTAATVHITPHEEGMVPNKDDKMKGLAITVGNWAQEITTMHGTIMGQMVNKNVIGVGTAILNDVVYSPQMKYNLCSLSWLMDDGWKMTGDTKGIMMVKKGHKLVFDVLVGSDTTSVYCLYIN